MATSKRQRNKLFKSIIILSLLAPTALTACSDFTPKIIPITNCTSSTGDSASSQWGINFSIAGKSVCVLPALLTNITHIIGTELCDSIPTTNSSSCSNKIGITFDPNDAGGSFKTPEPDEFQLPVDSFFNQVINKPNAGEKQTEIRTADVEIGGKLKLEEFVFDLVVRGWQFGQHLLGIGNGSSFLKMLVDKGEIPYRAFAIWMGSQSYWNPLRGSFIFGGYDASISDNVLLHKFDIKLDPVDLLNLEKSKKRICPIRVSLSSLNFYVDGDRTNPVVLKEPSQDLEACLEMFDEKIRAPRSKIKDLEERLGFAEKGVNFESLVAQGLEIPERGLYFKGNADIRGELEVKIELPDGGEFVVVIPSDELVGPARGWKDGRWVTLTNTTELAIFNDTVVQERVVLSRVFLSRVYFIVDYDAEKFWLGNIPDDYIRNQAAAQLEAIPGREACKDKDGGGKTALIVGSVLGSLGFVALIAALLLFFLYYRRRQRRDQEAEAFTAAQYYRASTVTQGSHWPPSAAGSHIPPDAQPIEAPGTQTPRPPEMVETNAADTHAPRNGNAHPSLSSETEDNELQDEERKKDALGVVVRYLPTQIELSIRTMLAGILTSSGN